MVTKPGLQMQEGAAPGALRMASGRAPPRSQRAKPEATPPWEVQRSVALHRGLLPSCRLGFLYFHSAQTGSAEPVALLALNQCKSSLPFVLVLTNSLLGAEEPRSHLWEEAWASHQAHLLPSQQAAPLPVLAP